MNPFNNAIGNILSKEKFYRKIQSLYDRQIVLEYDSNEELIESQIDALYVEFHEHYLFYKLVMNALKQNYSSYDMKKIKADRIDYRYDEDLGINRKGSFIIGGSGSGKTTMAKAIRYIVGRKIEFSQLNLTHIPILIVECPYKISTRNLCLNILEELDKELNTDYIITHNAKTEGDLFKKIQFLIAKHKIGLMIIDEVHNLLHFVKSKLSANSQKSQEVLKFFKSLANETQIPIIYIGIPGSEEVMNLSFQAYRRMAGNGTLKFPNLSPKSYDYIEVDSFDYFMERLWQIQVPGQKQKLTQEIKDAYYIASLGSPDLLKNIHKFNLLNLLANKKEKFVIDKEYVKQVLKYRLTDYKKIANTFFDVENNTFIEFQLEKKNTAKSNNKKSKGKILNESGIKTPSSNSKLENRGVLSLLTKEANDNINRYNLLKANGHVVNLSDIN